MDLPSPSNMIPGRTNENPSFRSIEFRNNQQYCDHWRPVPNYDFRRPRLRKKNYKNSWDLTRYKVDHRFKPNLDFVSEKINSNQSIWQQNTKQYFIAQNNLHQPPGSRPSATPQTKSRVRNKFHKKLCNTNGKKSEVRKKAEKTIPIPSTEPENAGNENLSTQELKIETEQEKTTSSTNTEQEIEEAEKVNSKESDKPKISLIPLSNLIKQELQNLSQEESTLVSPTIQSPTQPSNRPVCRPNLVQRRRNPSGSCTSNAIAKEVVNKVAKMDKVGIKNVINNYGSKYDAALKMQARKHLREEIRKQLKSMNFEQPTDTENSAIVVPDEIVDSIHIPDIILDEIRRAFGCEFLQNDSLNKTNGDSAIIATTPAPLIDEPCPLQPELNEAISCVPRFPTDPPCISSDLMIRLKTAEETKNQAEKQLQDVGKIKTRNVRKSSSQGVPTTRRGRQKRIDTSTEIIVIQSSASSRSSSSSSSSTSSSSSSSSNSSDSRSSSLLDRRSKPKIDTDNVIDSFEKLILPYMTEQKRLSYRTKFVTPWRKLRFVFYTCIGKLNPKTITKKEKNLIKKKLSSRDNSIALKFLSKEILNIFNKHKESRRILCESANKTKNPIPRERNQIATNSNVILKELTTNGFTESDKQDICEMSVTEKSTPTPKGKTADTAVSKSALASQSKSDSSSIVLLSSSPHQSGGVNKNQTETCGGDENVNSASSGVENAHLVAEVLMPPELLSDETAVKAQDAEKQANRDDNELGYQQNSSSIENSEAHSAETGSRPFGEINRLHIKPPSFDISLGGLSTDFNGIRNLGSMLPSCMPEIDLESFRQQSQIGEVVVNNLREIDFQLMELHKRKIFIEEMILKLQKDKMESDLLTMKLQHEKFILLNTAMMTSATNRMPLNSSAVKSEEFSTQAFAKRKYEIEENTMKRHCSNNNTKTSPIALKEDPKTIPTESTPTLTDPDHATTSSAIQQSTSLTSDEDPPDNNESPSTVDYTNVMNGNFLGIKNPITQIIVKDSSILAASEDGSLYEYNIHSLKLEKQFNKHSEAITQMYFCNHKKVLYTTSLDGYLKKTCIENFDLDIQSVYVQEPLQAMDLKWETAFIGSRWGNIFTYDTKTNYLSESLLCSSESSVIALKATKEGPRKILIVSSKGNQINFRDATSGLLLRSLEAPDSLNFYSLLLDIGCIYCGTQKNEIYRYDFTTGAKLSTFKCGNGAISIKLYKGKFIFVGCYDGFVYVLDKITGDQIGRFPGSGKMILSLELAGDKIITCAKDKSMQINDIPKYIVTKAKS